MAYRSRTRWGTGAAGGSKPTSSLASLSSLRTTSPSHQRNAYGSQLGQGESQLSLDRVETRTPGPEVLSTAASELSLAESDDFKARPARAYADSRGVSDNPAKRREAHILLSRQRSGEANHDVSPRAESTSPDAEPPARPPPPSEVLRRLHTGQENGLTSSAASSPSPPVSTISSAGPSSGRQVNENAGEPDQLSPLATAPSTHTQRERSNPPVPRRSPSTVLSSSSSVEEVEASTRQPFARGSSSGQENGPLRSNVTGYQVHAHSIHGRSLAAPPQRSLSPSSGVGRVTVEHLETGNAQSDTQVDESLQARQYSHQYNGQQHPQQYEPQSSAQDINLRQQENGSMSMDQLRPSSPDKDRATPFTPRSPHRTQQRYTPTPRITEPSPFDSIHSLAPWHRKHLFRIVQNATASNQQRLRKASPRVLNHFSVFLYRFLVRISNEARSLSWRFGRCAKHEVAASLQMLVSQKLASACLSAGTKALLQYSLPTNFLKTSKSTRAGLVLPIGRLHQWMVNYEVAPAITDDAAICLAAALEAFGEILVRRANGVEDEKTDKRECLCLRLFARFE